MTIEAKKEQTEEGAEETSPHNERREENQNSSEIALDFPTLKRKAKVVWDKIKPSKSASTFQGTQEKSDDIKFEIKNIQKIGQFAHANSSWLIPLICILLIMAVSVFLHTMPFRMPVTDDWAQNTVYNYYQNQVQQQLAQQYPNLPPNNRDALAKTEFEKLLKENGEMIESQINELSNQYKSQLRDPEGNTYILGIDPYHFYRQAKNVLEYGHVGTTEKNGALFDMYMHAPSGAPTENSFHPLFTAYWHKFLSTFTKIPLAVSFMLVGVLFSALVVIPAFFIGRRTSQNIVGGIFTAFLITVSPFFVARTTGESSDTDVYVVFFPLLITWLFLEAFEATDTKRLLLYITAAGLGTGLFAFAWPGWSYIFNFIVATVVLYLIYFAAMHWKERSKLLQEKKVQRTGIVFAAYLIASGIFVTLFTTFNSFIDAPLEPISFIKLKEVAVTSIWPKVATTVAELNVPPFSQVVDQLGGRFLFALAVIGVLLVAMKKDTHGHRNLKVSIMLTIWFIGSLYTTTKGVRFILLATPVLAIALGAFMGIVWGEVSKWITQKTGMNKRVSQVIIFGLLAILVVQPTMAGYDTAYGSIPSVNDGWYDALAKIKMETPKDTIITSWWDFGHWFKAIADRRVTFDGASRSSASAHWVGKSLLISDEKKSIGILRMLDCGNNNAFETLNKMLNDGPKSVEIINRVITLTKEEAVQILQSEGLTTAQADEVLQYSHCVPPSGILITSEDMVSKGGVWGHFGSWDFRKADMYQSVNGLEDMQAVAMLTSKFNMNVEEARRALIEMRSTSADNWIAPWPGYQGRHGCSSINETTLDCSLNLAQGSGSMVIDLTTMEASIPTNAGFLHPASIVFLAGGKVQEKQFANGNIGFSIILLPNNQEVIVTHPAQARSIFSQLFFFDGAGSQCFTKFDDRSSFTGGRVVSWNINWNCLNP